MNNEELIRKLKRDNELILSKKLDKALREDNFGTYKNLVSVLKGNIDIVNELSKDDFKLMYSEYETNGKKQVSVWEQNGNGEVRNHKFWDVLLDNNTYDIVGNTLTGVTDKHCVAPLFSNIKLNGDFFYEEWERRFLMYIDLHDNRPTQIIIPTNELTRNIGKTTFLLKQAINNKGIYIAPTKSVAQYAQSKAFLLFGEVPKVEYMDINNEGLIVRLNTMLYIDEGVDLSKIDLDRNEYVAFKHTV